MNSAHSIGKILMAATVLAVALGGFVGCKKYKPVKNKTDEPTAQTEGCDHFQPATGKREKIPHPVAPSECKLVILMCNYCAYDASGAFEGSGSEPCGACIGADF